MQPNKPPTRDPRGMHPVNIGGGQHHRPAKCPSCTELIGYLRDAVAELADLQQLHDNFVTIASYELARAIQARKALEDALGMGRSTGDLPN